jgi:SSS family solute:Na+ symporter
MSIVFFISLGLAVVVSLAKPAAAERNLITMKGVSFRTPTSFNIAALIIVAMLVALYAIWW